MHQNLNYAENPMKSYKNKTKQNKNNPVIVKNFISQRNETKQNKIKCIDQAGETLLFTKTNGIKLKTYK